MAFNIKQSKPGGVGVDLDAQSTPAENAITLRNTFVGLSGGYAVGGSHQLNDRTRLWFNHAAVGNGMDAHYDIGQVEDNCNHYLPADGQNASAVSLGIRHKFQV